MIAAMQQLQAAVQCHPRLRAEGLFQCNSFQATLDCVPALQACPGDYQGSGKLLQQLGAMP
eukprot:4586382-Alexandrium_andersonii.AAC.1